MVEQYLLPPETIERVILPVCGHKVILDSDLQPSTASRRAG
jgi:hypothetical protein